MVITKSTMTQLKMRKGTVGHSHKKSTMFHLEMRNPTIFQMDNFSESTLRPKGPSTAINPKLTEFYFDSSDFIDALDSLSNKASPSPDGIPALLFKGAKPTVSRLLTNIFKSSYDTGNILQILKLAQNMS